MLRWYVLCANAVRAIGTLAAGAELGKGGPGVGHARDGGNGCAHARERAQPGERRLDGLAGLVQRSWTLPVLEVLIRWIRTLIPSIPQSDLDLRCLLVDDLDIHDL